MKKNLPLSGACRKYEEDLVLFYYGEIDAAERQRVEGHLSQCAACQQFVDDLRGLLPQLAKNQEMPESFWQSYYRETIAKLDKRQADKDWWVNLLTPWKTWLVPAFGTAAVALLAFALLFDKGSLPFSTNGSSAKLPEEVISDANQLEFFGSLDMLESLSQIEPQENGRQKNRPEQSSLVLGERSAA